VQAKRGCPVIIPDLTPQTDEDWQARVYDALEAFSPGAPIDELSLLAGRRPQIERMIETVMQRGQHAILYGERGVGKSSLANTFATRLFGKTRILLCVPVNCHPSDDFSAVWRKVFRRLEVDGQNLAQKYSNKIEPDDVVLELSGFSLNTVPIVILDEFDKLPNKEAQNLIANTIKNLSDRSVKTTVILVGVADSVSDLIEEHQSVSRCLRQIQMQRMNAAELREIIETRLAKLGMKIQPDALAHIVSIARGLPHYAHLLGQQSAKATLEDKSLIVEMTYVEKAIPECIRETAQTIREDYHKATMSPRRENIYKEVLLASALARVDDLGYFAPADLRAPLSALLDRDAPVSLYGQHLSVRPKTF
jgi:Cdc6-like AAA superfamily ATPase